MVDIDYALVGKKMKQLRNERGITQDKIAKDLGCTVAFVSNVENHRTKLNLRMLCYYAELCNVSTDTLLNAGRPGCEEAEESATTAREMERIFQKYSSKEKEKIIKLLKMWKED